MSQIIQNKRKFMYPDDEAPEKKLISDGDLLIKQLAEKQRNTKTTLQEYLSNEKQFERITEYVPLTSSGVSSLKDLQKIKEHTESIENLKSIGLSNADIQLYLDNKEGEECLLGKHKNFERSVLKQRIYEIHELIKSDQSLTKSQDEVSPQNRLKTQFALSIKPDSLETKLLKFSLQAQRKQETLPYPINDICKIERDRFGYLNDDSLPSVTRIRRKARKLAKRILNLPVNSTTVSAKASLWDVKEKVQIEPKTVQVKTYTCKPQNYYTIRNGEIVNLNKTELKSTGLATIKQRLTTDEIRELPKFKDYCHGNPSKILYLQNLGSSVNESDLKTVFKNYDNGNVSYKIMKGRMRGQAFVTFSNEVTAAESLDGVNGMFIRNRPVVIQFGQNKNAKAYFIKKS